MIVLSALYFHLGRIVGIRVGYLKGRKAVRDYYETKERVRVWKQVKSYYQLLTSLETEDEYIARLQETADHIDSYIDACAYLALACELITEKDEKYV